MNRTPARPRRSPDTGTSDGLVFDSYAILCLLGDEPGADEVADLLESGPELLLMTFVNLGEILYTIMRERGSDQADAALLALEASRLTFVPAERALTLAAARLKARHRVSYADAFCAALSHISGLPLLTGDPEFQDLEREVQVRWLGEPSK